MDDAEISRFWADARVRGGLNPVESYIGASASSVVPPPAWSYGSTPQESDRFVEQVLAGARTATSSLLSSYEEEAQRQAALEESRPVEASGDTLVRTAVDVALPEPGLLSIVLDGQERPRALIRTTHVQVARLGDVDAEHARREGEHSLESWRRTVRTTLAAELAEGEVLGDDTRVVLERFVCVVPATARRAARRAGLL
ncbi:hypothetical protein GCM10009584_29590 [Ornithinimicrobium humiphilum]|uniref:Uncharacterized protein YhfF n=1 Tax=Ornithinimicrobium humiphilum TaxID=125288 RepID=A0A543K6K4_9MICO|nr:ASCH domain-containing protein [Ornithinimicrobium humiphilum]TQM90690.1 uncharacterized protein YhfF [Ornithinimicrobium humiphilum]